MPSLIRDVKLISWLTLAWLAIDGAIGMAGGLMANSVALIGWGLDCAIEAAAAAVIIGRFTGTRIDSGRAEQLARRVMAISFMPARPLTSRPGPSATCSPAPPRRQAGPGSAWPPPMPY